MRRLVVELSLQDFIGNDPKSPFKNIESCEMVQIFRQEEGIYDGIIRLKFEKSQTRIEDIFSDTREVQLLDEDEKSGFKFFLVKGHNPTGWRGVLSIANLSGGYVPLPCGVVDGKVRINFLGSSSEVKKFLKIFGKSWPRFKVLLLSDAKFSPYSPLSYLTKKQSKVLVTAFNLGYYDLPRRIGSQELAEKLGIKGSALIAHRRKAERHVLDQLINR